MASVKFNKLEKSLTISANSEVKVTQMNHIIEIIHVANESSTLGNYLKIDKEHYFVINRETGEVLDTKEYNISGNRAENIEGLKQTFKNLRDLINNNFSGAKNELFITLTYRLINGKPMNDIKKAAKDFDRFIKRFRRRYPDLEHLAILEPQTSSWHWHVLAKFTYWREKSHIRIDNNKIIEPLWGHGFTNTKAICHADNIGAYLSAYLASVEINDENKMEIFDSIYKSGRDIVIEEKEVTGADGKKVLKKFVKGGRMYLYPSGANIYRHSRGIIKPTSQSMTYADAKKITGKKAPNFSRTIKISGGKENRVFNTVTYESYNLKRKKPPKKNVPHP